MYKQFFGLRKAPFNLTPDPEFLYLTEQHREALANFIYGILAHKGIVSLTGNAGTGKTTLLMRMLQHLQPTRMQSSLIVNPTLTPSEFLEAAMLDFGFDNIPTSKAQRIVKLQSFLVQARQEGRATVLIVDEAHKLSFELLEEIRLLGNFQAAGETLLQIVLVGQPELDTVLNSGELMQFKQRISLRATIAPLTPEDVGAYIQHRWAVAGGERMPFSVAAVDCIGQAAHRVPRLINAICDNALGNAYADGSPRVEMRHVLAACKDLQLDAAVPRNGAQPQAKPVPAAVMSRQMSTLERRADEPVRRPSLLVRLRSRFRETQRIETA